MKKNLLSFFISLITISISAQTVTIPDLYFRQRLKHIMPECFVGDLLDTNCTTVKTTEDLVLHGSSITHNIKSLEGLHYFPNLISVACTSTLVTIVPQFPPKIRSIDLHDNPNLTSIAPLPAGVTNLSISNTSLPKIPVLPPALIGFSCSRMRPLIDSLPDLPATLQFLDCSHNSIKVMPPLPANLVQLYCTRNELTELPELNNKLKYLVCDSNQLTQLPAFPNSLQSISCSNNQITEIITFGNLSSIACAHNLLTQLPEFPFEFGGIDCSYNMISKLPALPPFMTNLFIKSTLITCLPELPPTLYNLSTDVTCLPNIPSQLNQNTLPLCNTNDGCPSPLTSAKDQSIVGNVSVYPNPVGEDKTLSLQTDTYTKVRMINAQGNLVWLGEIKGQTTIDLSQFATGLYHIDFEQNGKHVKEKLVLK